MREITYGEIASSVEAMFIEACVDMGDDVETALMHALENETSAYGRFTLEQLIENISAARSKRMPACQDTGMAVVFLELGQDARITGGYLYDAINSGVARAYEKGYLRKSVLTPIKRENTKTNTPAIIHTEIVKGDRLTIYACPKGFGSENQSRVKMLNPSDGREGIIDFVVDAVRVGGASACPPLVVAVGIGGTMEKAAILAKQQLLRPVGQQSPDSEAAELEAELLSRINALGIGPMGLGGVTTALAVHAALFPTHIAGLPVAVNMQCHAARHKRCIL